MTYTKQNCSDYNYKSALLHATSSLLLAKLVPIEITKNILLHD